MRSLIKDQGIITHQLRPNTCFPMRLPITLSTILLCGTLVVAEELTKTARDRAAIRMLFETRCVSCHGPDQQKGELRLDSPSGILSGGKNGPLINSENLDASLILKRVQGDASGPRMPLDDDPLTARELESLRRWAVLGGGLEPESTTVPVEPAGHWSYQAIRRPDQPQVQDHAWPHNAIDRFILYRLEQQQRRPNVEADRAVLLRRVSLDLTGLPPTLEQLETYLADHGPDAFEQAVDRLLASAQYAERWAQPWLDLARYADTNGYQADQYRTVWPYRDWVIQSIAHDMPFDHFTVEQIAGDLLPDPTIRQRIATGFHRLTTCNVEAGVDPEENRIQQVVDRVNTTGAVWLGTTLACAQCHDHKYDPFSQHDYYRLFACFNNTPLEVERKDHKGVQYEFVGPTLELPLSTEEVLQRQNLQASRNATQAALRSLRETLIAAQPAWESALQPSASGTEVSSTAGAAQSIPASIAKILATPSSDRDKKQNTALRKFYMNRDPRFAALQETLKQQARKIVAIQPVSTLQMVEMSRARTTHILQRGDFESRGEVVSGGTPQHLPGLEALTETNFTRLELARWLVTPTNPLTARVTVNRWWYQFFGRGIASTLNDLGTRGARPTHPELLDWLATELMESDWSRKHIHRLIVTSSTYRQSSVASPKAWARDPNNTAYARGPRVRLAAELIRDNVLATSGLLDYRVGGAPVFPPQPEHIWRHIGRNAPQYATSVGAQRYRRGLYTFWRRSAPYPAYVNFDAPDRAECVLQRPRTNTPLQALTLMNDQAFLEIACGFAYDLLETEEPDTEPLANRVRRAFRRCLTREPNQTELNHLVEIYQETLAACVRDPARAVYCQRLLAQPFRDLLKAEDLPRLAAWFQVAHVLFNLDETITKG